MISNAKASGRVLRRRRDLDLKAAEYTLRYQSPDFYLACEARVEPVKRFD